MRAGEKLVKFSRIVFNFPCVGLLDEQQQHIASGVMIMTALDVVVVDASAVPFAVPVVTFASSSV